jgi:hypothetical protein
VEHNRLLVDVARLMGLSDVEKFGTTDTRAGGLTGFV